MYTKNEIDALYALWLASTKEESALQSELESIAGDEAAILDRFYRELEFGTGGLRGVIGAGTNRVNVYTIAKASQGFASDLLARCKKPSVCISYDSRINSTLFAKTAAGVFAANGIKVYIWGELMPTPALSFAVRNKKADGGVMITASHNPAKYNGYKVYGADGCQINIETADRILKQIEAADVFTGVKRMAYEKALASGMVERIGEDVFDAFMDAVSAQGINVDCIDKNVSITYTPLNGAGKRCVTTILARNGFNKVSLVASQAEPDGNFPTCPYPNPEIREALEEGLKAAAQNQSDLLIATDPDCDRMGIAVRDQNEYRLLSGNQVGVLLFDYICAQRLCRHTMPQNPVAVKTIVTTEMAAKVAEHYSVKLYDVLTGFKFIGEVIGELEKDGLEDRYIFGFEESYGYLSGGYVRDKDAVNASLLTAEMFAYYKGKGLTLFEVLDSLSKKYGYFENALDNFAFEGASGFETMQRIMGDFTKNAPVPRGRRLLERTDFLAQTVYLANGDKKSTKLPASSVLRFRYDDDLSVVVRPSGTEPKLKIYYSVKADSADQAKELSDAVRGFFRGLIEGYKA